MTEREEVAADSAAAEAPSDAAALVAFWQAAGYERWFKQEESFDAACRERWLALHEHAAAGALAGWSASPTGALALVLLLDQIPRNIFRGTARAWATDPAALGVAEAAIACGFDPEVAPELRRFFYLPFSHAEEIVAQDRAVALYEAAEPQGLDAPTSDAVTSDAVTWARHHRDIIARFDRFPHRNTVLGRESTPEELAFLAESDFRG